MGVWSKVIVSPHISRRHGDLQPARGRDLRRRICAATSTATRSKRRRSRARYTECDGDGVLITSDYSIAASSENPAWRSPSRARSRSARRGRLSGTTRSSCCRTSSGCLRKRGAIRPTSARFVDIGPGGYAGLRVGVSIAKALAHALGVPIVGVGRLELDAWLVVPMPASAVSSPCIERGGVRSPGRRTLPRRTAIWREDAAPRIAKVDVLIAELREGDAVTGDIDDALTDRGARCGRRRSDAARTPRRGARGARLRASDRRPSDRSCGARAPILARAQPSARNRLNRPTN